MTADEKLWPKKGNILFLGDWCKLYHRSFVWKKLNGDDANPYVVNKKQYGEDFKYTENLYNLFIKRLSYTLNIIHNKNFTEKDWEGIIGHWLKRYLIVFFNRYNTLKMCLENYNVTKVNFYPENSFSLTTRNINEFIKGCDDPTWNSVFWQQIFNELNKNKIKVNYVSKPKKNILVLQQKSHKRFISRIFINWLSKYFSSKAKIMIINSYLPKKFMVLLCLSLKMFPQIWQTSEGIITSKKNKNIRKKLLNLLKYKEDNKYILLCSELLIQTIPLSYLEGLKEIELNVEKRGFPKEPKVIFTSNNFFADEEFKLWVIKQRAMNAKYIIGQHGSNYGTERFNSPKLEEELPDKFISWGNIQYQKNIVPGFVFSYPQANIIKHNKKGQLLLVELSPPLHFYHHDAHHTFKKYFESQINFYNNLNYNLKNNIIVRLPEQSKILHFNEIERWKKINKKIKLDNFSCSMKKSINKSSIIIFSYFSTGFLECLNQNIPTLGFWEEPLYVVLNKCKKDFKELIDIKVIHSNSISASNHLNLLGNNIDDWWYSDNVQKVRLNFISKYANIEKRPINFLKKIILD